MKRDEHDRLVLEAHREWAEAIANEDALLADVASARDRREAAHARLKQLARIEVSNG